MNPKRLTKGHDRMVCGVCSGIAEYLGLDTTLVRLGVAVLSLFTCVGIVAYFVAGVIMPEPMDPPYGGQQGPSNTDYNQPL